MPTSLVLRLWLLAAAPSASGPPPDFEATLDRAEQLWSQGDDQGVADLFAQAYRDDPRPEYLFGQARAEIAMKHCERGRMLLDQLLAQAIPAQIERAAEQLRARCPDPPTDPATNPATNTSGDPPPVTTPSTDPGPDPTPAPPPDAPPATRRARRAGPRDWRSDPAGWSLVGVGVAAGVVGAGLWGGGAGRLSSPPSTIDEDAHAAYTRRWQRTGRSGMVVASVGATLVLAGVIRLAVLARRSSLAGPSTARRRGRGRAQ